MNVFQRAGIINLTVLQNERRERNRRTGAVGQVKAARVVSVCFIVMESGYKASSGACEFCLTSSKPTALWIGSKRAWTTLNGRIN